MKSRPTIRSAHGINPLASSRRVLITGGAGFIGSHLAEALLADGHQVRVLDDLSTGAVDNLQPVWRHGNFEWREGSVLDPHVVGEAMQGVEFVFHLAAVVGVSLVMRSPVATIQCNVQGTENVLAAAARASAGILVASTSEVYGRRQRGLLKEDQELRMRPPTSPRWGYACSKLMDEFLALAYWRERGLPVVVARLFNVVGLRQSGQYGMVMPRFVQQAVRGEPISVHGDGTQSRCFCHVQDVVRALKGLACHPSALGEIFNIGSTEPVTILALAKRVRDLAESRSELRLVPYEKAYSRQFEDIPHRAPSIQKISKLMGWAPKDDLEAILRPMIAAERRRISAERTEGRASHESTPAMGGLRV